MIGWIIWLVGVILTIRAIYEIFQLDAPLWKRLIAIVILFVTSWFGLLFYYLYAKPRIGGWLN